MSTRRKRASSISKENTQCKGIKLSDEIKKKSVCTMSKKEESLLGKVTCRMFELLFHMCFKTDRIMLFITSALFVGSTEDLY